jgi:hypothetical protein
MDHTAPSTMIAPTIANAARRQASTPTRPKTTGTTYAPCGRVRVIKVVPTPKTASENHAPRIVRASRYATMPNAVSIVSKKKVSSVMMCFTCTNGSNEAIKISETTNAPTRGDKSRAVK